MIGGRVQTLDPDRLQQTALALYAKASAEFHPQIVIGIRSGGYHIAKLMQAGFEPGVRLLPVTCQRPGTAGKSQSWLFRQILKHLPHFITDGLRIVEHKFLMRKGMPSDRTIPESELADIGTALEGLSAPCILVVDDAVDSGATLLTVRQKIAALASPRAAIHTAAITVTTMAPLIEPDYVIYRNVLCRFPWSFDYR